MSISRRSEVRALSPVPQGTGPRITLPRTDNALEGEWNRLHSLRFVPPAWAAHCPVPWDLAFAPSERRWIMVAMDERTVDVHDDLVARYSADRECRHMNLPEEGCPEGCFAKADSPSAEK